eukprot:13420742-Ditylum_brightwellii.AAC.1
MVCSTSYHPACIQAEPPFHTCFSNGQGLAYPSLASLAGFICEACTVKSALGRELHRSAKDAYLQRLEQMQMIDNTHV